MVHRASMEIKELEDRGNKQGCARGMMKSPI